MFCYWRGNDILAINKYKGAFSPFSFRSLLMNSQIVRIMKIKTMSQIHVAVPLTQVSIVWT